MLPCKDDPVRFNQWNLGRERLSQQAWEKDIDDREGGGKASIVQIKFEIFSGAPSRQHKKVNSGTCPFKHYHRASVLHERHAP